MGSNCLESLLGSSHIIRSILISTLNTEIIIRVIVNNPGDLSSLNVLDVYIFVDVRIDSDILNVLNVLDLLDVLCTFIVCSALNDCDILDVLNP